MQMFVLIECADVATGLIFRGLARAFSLDFFVMQCHVCPSNRISGLFVANFVFQPISQVF
jgi:hypothetical protein